MRIDGWILPLLISNLKRMKSSAPSAEQEYWTEVTVRNCRASYKEYLAKYPNGQFKAQAQRHLEWFDRFDHTDFYPYRRENKVIWVLFAVLIVGAGIALGFFLF